jgi:class 3 adenylate cyclase
VRKSSTVFFTGHMVDRPGRAVPRFPSANVDKIAARIASELEACGAVDGFASAACGSDILFHESIIARGGHAHIVLPCGVDTFRTDCVDVIPNSDWSTRFDAILQAATSVEILSEQYASDNAMASEFCNRVMLGMAQRCAFEKGQLPMVIALWDGRPGDAVGGTHSAVQYCLTHGLKVRLMNDLSPSTSPDGSDLLPVVNGTSSAVSERSAEAPQNICALMFADAVGYSSLREREIPIFVRHYLTCAMLALQGCAIVPLVHNTWGDGLYFVFDSVRDAGVFAIDFRDRILATNWLSLGLTNRFSVRIALHAGALYRIYDPVIGRWTYVGAEVTRAARLEPSTDPGKIFASLAFAALASAENVTTFTCREVGKLRLYKNAGEATVYEVVAGQNSIG